MDTYHLLVLAGGFGTRLKETVSDVPKALAPVNGKPCLYYLIENWAAQGINRFTFLLHHKAELIEEFLESLKKEIWLKDCEINSVKEPVPMGTGGAVAYAVRQNRIDGEFLVANADTWLGSGIREILNAESPAIATIEVSNTGRYGSVQVNKGKVMDFEEKQKNPGPGLINTGLYKLDDSNFMSWDGKPFSLERELFPQLVTDGKLTAVKINTDFIDIGIPEDYFRFCQWIESEKAGVL